MGKALQINSDSFVNEVLEYPGVVLVDFWGPGCAPCRALAPVLDAISEANDGVAKVVKIDISESDDVANHYGITTIPTILVFKNGDLIDQLMGVQSKVKLQSIIDDNK
ncbi:MAG: thioredoxin [Planctomycetaceae bacterium]|nr:thioredoxin [Planctomycetaceae bacterium]MBQ2822893.1 thioredoxin [Thermoguttaceae bacterium]MDO4425442.1 thioredoxin [Planctomycetia bacterium]